MINVKRIDHVQLCIPEGKEEEARGFYEGILGFEEIPKPQSLIPNGGMWYKAGAAEIHIGVERFEAEKSKRHPAFEIHNVTATRAYLEEKGVKTQDEKPIPNVNRFSFFDPFGNRIEFLEKLPEDGTTLAKEKTLVKEQFSKSAEAYVTSEIHAKGKDLAKLVEIAWFKSSDRVLDVATGGGHVANAAAPYVDSVVAFDLTEKMLEAARGFISGNGHSNVEYVQGDAENMPFADGSFDVVTCRIAPHHFPNLDSFIAEAARVLKQGGSFLLVDNVVPEDDDCDAFYNEVEKRRDPSHYRAWKKSEWLTKLEKCGFVIEEMHRFPKTFKFVSWFERMHLPKEEMDRLSAYMMNASDKIKQKFVIEIEDLYVKSFQGDSILLKAIKQ